MELQLFSFCVFLVLSSCLKYVNCTAPGGLENIYPNHFDEFNISSSDVMVFLHIQKTGGTYFGHKLVRSLILPKACVKISGTKRSQCLRSETNDDTWLFSRYSTGWQCGLHADWTELKGCVPQKMEEINYGSNFMYFYITGLRDPIKRFVSEWSHTNRDGSNWRKTKYSCGSNGNIIPKCYTGQTWQQVSLSEFLACPYNMAINRQTRMLANISLVNCYDLWLQRGMTSERRKALEETMLVSAKQNLVDMPFFYLLDQLVLSQKLFEKTFSLQFKENFVQRTSGKSTTDGLTESELQEIKRKNHLDIRLFEFALTLFDKRQLQYLSEEDASDVP